MKTKRVEFGGETYEVPAGAKPMSIAQAQRMQRTLRAAEKPAEAPKASPKGSGTRKANTASSTTSSASTSGVKDSKIETSVLPRRMSRMDDARETAKGRRIARDAMDAIGASAKPAQENTRRVPTGESRSSEGGRVRYKGNDRLYADAEKANSLQLDIREGKYRRGERTNRNAAAIREKARRGLK